MKTKLTIIFLLITLVAFGQKKVKTDTVIAFKLNAIELPKVGKLYRQMDSLQTEVNKVWIGKMNALGFDEKNIIGIIPTRRDSLKVTIKK